MGYKPPSGVTSFTITDTEVVASEVAMLALNAQTGDIAIRTDLSKSFILKTNDPTILVNWEELLFSSPVISVAGKTGAVTLDPSDVGSEPSGTAASEIENHAEHVDAHHARYEDSEAVSAMGAKGDSNPLNHDRYTDGEAVSALSGALAGKSDTSHNHNSEWTPQFIVPTSGAITADFSTSRAVVITATGDVQITLTNLRPGPNRILVIQDAVGGHAVTYTTTVYGIDATPSTDADAVDLHLIDYINSIPILGIYPIPEISW